MDIACTNLDRLMGQENARFRRLQSKVDSITSPFKVVHRERNALKRTAYIFATSPFLMIKSAIEMLLACRETKKILVLVEQHCGECASPCELLHRMKDLVDFGVRALSLFESKSRQFVFIRPFHGRFLKWRDYFEDYQETLAISLDPEIRSLLEAYAEGLAAKYAHR